MYLPRYMDILDELESPIALDTRKATPVELPPIVYTKVFSNNTTGLVNVGHTVWAYLSHPGSMTGGPFGDKYRLKAVHFDIVPEGYTSSHAIDNKKYALEAQFVFKNSFHINIVDEIFEAYEALIEKQHELDEEEDEEEREKLEDELKVLEADLLDLEENAIAERWQREKSKFAVKARKATGFVNWGDSSSVLVLGDIKARESASIASEEIRIESPEEVAANEIEESEKFIRKRVELDAHMIAKKEYMDFVKKEKLVDEASARTEEYLETLNTDAPTQTSGKKQTKAMKREQELRQQKKEKEAQARQEKIRSRREEDWIRIQNKNVEVTAIITVLFEITDDAPEYNIFTFLSHVQQPYSRIMVDGNLFVDFQNVLQSPDYFIYHGKMVTQPFSPRIQHIVMKNPLPISKRQLEYFNTVKMDGGQRITTEIKELQPLKGRKIYLNREPEVKEGFPTCPGKDLCMCSGNLDDVSWEKFKNV